MVALKATRSEPIIKESILESGEGSEAEASIMKVLDKLYPLGIICGRILTIQACFGFIGDSVLNEAVRRLVRFHLRCDIELACWVCEVNSVLGRITKCLQRCILVVWV